MGKDNCYSGLALDIQRIGLENKALFNKKFLLKGLLKIIFIRILPTENKKTPCGKAKQGIKQNTINSLSINTPVRDFIFWSIEYQNHRRQIANRDSFLSDPRLPANVNPGYLNNPMGEKM